MLPHALSLSRIVLGAIVLAELLRDHHSPLVLPAVIAAAAADYFDGRIARSMDTATLTGRLIDNLCDAAFLAFALSGFAIATTWSVPMFGSATRYWEYANWLPVIGLAASFGTYMLRWYLSARAGREPTPSPRGHTAGVANYVLVLIGGVAVYPGVDLTPWLLEPSFVTVALLNLTGAGENIGLIVQDFFSS